MKLTLEQVKLFLDEHAKQPVSDIVTLSGGQWSQAFGFGEAGKDYVIRFGQHEEDYLKDQLASKFMSDKLPIPKVLHVGKSFDGYFAISERAFGTMLDDLDKPAMKRVIPSLFRTLDGIRETHISNGGGYGAWDTKGSGKYQSWREFLLDVVNDRPDSRTHGWKAGLKNSPIGDGPFNEAYSLLTKLSSGLPEVRSLIHNDLVNFNVIVNEDRITAVFDWANALYGDFLYDLAMFTLWGAIHKPIMGVDWEAEAIAHYKAIGLEVPQFKRRLQCCMVHLGLDAQAYYGYKQDWEWLEPMAKRTLEIANSI
ncbi:MAG TPA: phosphotransferase [Candidatus Saccharimonadales bacterium]